MPQRTTQTVQPPDHQCVSWPQLVEELGEMRSLVEASGGGVEEDPVTAGRLESVPLNIEALFQRRDATVAKKVPHNPENVSEPPEVMVVRRCFRTRVLVAPGASPAAGPPSSHKRSF